MTRERPILFSGPMVRAILEGGKTQTRRLVRGLPPDAIHVRLAVDEIKYGSYDDPNTAFGRIPCPYGTPGDLLWVRETWSQESYSGRDLHTSQPIHEVVIRYQADGSSRTIRRPEATHGGELRRDGGVAWRPCIFMPRWASRITLEITDVRVQRLQDISEEDALAEGCDPADQRMRPSAAFHRLWDSINGKRAPWESNPWVWALTFRVLEVASCNLL